MLLRFTWLDHDFQVSSNINCLLTKRIEQTGINFLLIFPKLKRQDLTTSRRLHFQFNLRSNPCPLHALLKKTTLTAFIGARALFEHIMRYFSRSKFRVEIPLTMLVHLDMTRLLILTKFPLIWNCLLSLDFTTKRERIDWNKFLSVFPR